jgi:hypothetical protein
VYGRGVNESDNIQFYLWSDLRNGENYLIRIRIYIKKITDKNMIWLSVFNRLAIIHQYPILFKYIWSDIRFYPKKYPKYFYYIFLIRFLVYIINLIYFIFNLC